MKYRTFILIRNLIGAGLIGVAGFGVVKGCTAVMQQASVSTPTSNALDRSSQTPSQSKPARPARRFAQAPKHQRTLTTAAAGTAAREPLSSLDRRVIELSKGPLTNGSSDGSGRKWRVKENRMVVELRSDTAKGSTTWNRIKIDLDRDKNWDEAWDLKPGKPIKRRIAPADDENYTVTYDLQGNTWVKREK